MKKLIAIIAASSLLCATAYAGSMIAPEMEPMVEVAEQEESASSSGLLLALLAIVGIGLLISNSDSSSTVST